MLPWALGARGCGTRGRPAWRGPLGSPGARAESNSVSASEPSQPPTGSAPRPPCHQPRAGRGRGGAHDRPAPTRRPPSGAPGGPSRGAGEPVTAVRGQQAHRLPLPTPQTPSWLRGSLQPGRRSSVLGAGCGSQSSDRQTDKTGSGRFGPPQSRCSLPVGWSQGAGRHMPSLRSASPAPPQCYIVIYIPN